MKTVRLVLITIGMALAAVLMASAQAGPVAPHARHTVIAPGGVVDPVRDEALWHVDPDERHGALTRGERHWSRCR